MPNLSGFSALYNENPQPVDPHTERLATDQRSLGWLIERIGFPAASLYGVLTGYRDLRATYAVSGQGPVWASNEALRGRMRTTHGGRRQGVSISTFKRALRALKSCGLVIHDPWGFGHGELSELGLTARRYGSHDGTAVRIVRGRIRALPNEMRVVDVPRETISQIEAKPKRTRNEKTDARTLGLVARYKRKFHALRKRWIAGEIVEQSDGVDWPTLFESLGTRPTGHGLGFHTDPCAASWTSNVFACARVVFGPRNVVWVTRSSQLREAHCSTKLTPLSNQIDPQLTTVKTKAFSKEKKPAPGANTSKDGKMSESLTWVPAYPLLVGKVNIAPPPKILDEMTDLEKASAMVIAYRAAYHRRTKQESLIFMRGDLRKSKHFAFLVAAANLCLKHDIAPHGWAAFSMNMADHFGRGATTPPITTVFALGRIAKHVDWYRMESVGYAASVGVLTESIRELVRDWEECMAALLVEPTDATVEKFFPGGCEEFTRRLLLAKRDAMEFKAAREEHAAKGFWIW